MKIDTANSVPKNLIASISDSFMIENLNSFDFGSGSMRRNDPSEEDLASALVVPRNGEGMPCKHLDSNRD